MAKTAIEKIFERALGLDVEEGEFVEVPVDFIYYHDGTGPLVFDHLKEMSVNEIPYPDKVGVCFDHSVPAYNEHVATLQKMVRDFSHRFGIKNVYDLGEGICHQVMAERGHIRPGIIVIGADSHTCTNGCFGTFSTGLGATDVAYALATGKLWFRIPETILIKLEGNLGSFVTSKDIIIRVIGEIGADGALGKAVEFSGSVVNKLTVSERMTMSNMSVEMGALTGFMKADERTLQYLKPRVKGEMYFFESDEGSHVKTYDFNIDDLVPQMACPSTVDNVCPVDEVKGIPIDQAFLGACTNGRIEDLEIAARLVKGRRVAPGVRFIVVPASRETYVRAIEKGLIEVFLNAGAIIGVPGCGPCLGCHFGVLGENEVCISSSNRNFTGRMGSQTAKIYLASPATVAASAIEGKITNPRDVFHEN